MYVRGGEASDKSGIVCSTIYIVYEKCMRLLVGVVKITSNEGRAQSRKSPHGKDRLYIEIERQIGYLNQDSSFLVLGRERENRERQGGVGVSPHLRQMIRLTSSIARREKGEGRTCVYVWHVVLETYGAYKTLLKCPFVFPLAVRLTRILFFIQLR